MSLDLAALKFIAFDFDSTLTDYVQADIGALRHLHASLGLSVSFNEFLDRAVEEIMAFHDRVEAGQSDPLRMNTERLERTLHAYGLTCTPEHVLSYTEQLVNATQPLPGAAELLAELRARGLPLALLSNAYDGQAQRTRIHACFPEQPFDVVIIAGETGRLKPDPLPFQMMLDALHLPAQAGVYVGDSPAHDMRGAVAVRMPGILIHPNLRVQDSARAAGASHVLNNLNQLGALLRPVPSH